jgi:hypothetical protein
MKILLILLLLTQIIKAPSWVCLIICAPTPIQPYEAIWKAVCQVESSNDPLAYHLENNGCASIGIAQISFRKLQDFNKATRKHYKHEEMYDPVKSREVFMWHAGGYNVWEKDKMIQKWNGRGSATIVYLKKVKKNIL